MSGALMAEYGISDGAATTLMWKARNLGFAIPTGHGPRRPQIRPLLVDAGSVGDRDVLPGISLSSVVERWEARVREGQQGIVKVACDLSVEPEQVRGWLREAAVAGFCLLPVTAMEGAEVDRLLKACRS